MFEKFSRSWALVKASAAVLRADKELLWFPVISSIAAMVVGATFFIPSLLGGLFDGGTGPMSLLVGFLFYVTQYCVLMGPSKFGSRTRGRSLFLPRLRQ